MEGADVRTGLRNGFYYFPFVQKEDFISVQLECVGEGYGFWLGGGVCLEITLINWLFML